jgi:alkanesulfonate monooxygenase SsuD/methylene tetrahydromethanopterin reductase-like flavin-dependent oxidoreductase (luciferase family)
VKDIAQYASALELAQIQQPLSYSAIGSAETVGQRLRSMLMETKTDELLVAGHFHDHAARLRSFEIAAVVREDLRGLCE